ncbi:MULTISPECIES: type III secretion system translocon subunit SctE [Stenotrophomonas]|jgi:invasin B|uniref:Type III secretion system translocon subunit SctE n=1 Tax=Stenotrophomonas aracearum TaxID=3003272 RepID=A0ABY9YAJ4_9GAMM|nr:MULTISPECIES: type III secretion system translocon subunit SctE [unclassified Stenotrophomonas]WNH47715.1 type III secretion system translocon subunit SctE [Stenotrophomonas sp. A5588]
MIITASASHTPLAFTGKTAARDDAPSIAAGFGSAPLQQVEAIDRKVLELLAKAAGDSNSSSAEAEAPNPNAPVLRRADMQRLVRAAVQAQAQATGTTPPRMTPEAAMTLLAMQLSELVTTENSRSLSSQLELVKQRLAQRAASAQELAEAIRLAQEVVDGAMADMGAAEGELLAAAEALKEAEAEVKRLEKALAEALPEDQEALRAQLETAKGKAAEAQTRVDDGISTLVQASNALNKALADLEDFKSQADKLDPNGSVSVRGDEKARTNAAALSELLAVLQEIIGKANDAKLEADTRLVQEVLRLREAENLRRSQEYQDELAKAEAAQKKMGCIGKIIGWVVTVVAVVAAPFTGGASMVLAGIGLALAIGEELGLNIMGKIMEPIMKLVMELVKAVGNVMGDVLTKLGVSSAFVDKIKDVLGVIVVAALIIAAVVLTKRVAGTVAVQQLAKAVTRAVTDAISKALPQMIKMLAQSAKSAVDDVAKAIAKTASKVTSSNADTLATRAGYATKASHTLQFANQTSQGVGAIVIADMQINAAELLAKLEVGLADSQIFRDLIQKILEYFMQTNTLVADLFKQMTNVQESEYETAQFVTSRVGHAA